MQNANPKVVGPHDGKAGFLGTIGVRFMIDGADADGQFSLVEHPMSPRALAAPMHRHRREDEYSYILQGSVGALLGDNVVIGKQGDLIFKPRNQWHTFWNAGETPARVLEIISPAGFEKFFGELIDLGGIAKMNADNLALDYVLCLAFAARAGNRDRQDTAQFALLHSILPLELIRSGGV